MAKPKFSTKDVMKTKITPLETLINQYEIPVDYDLNRFSRNGIHELAIDANFEFELTFEKNPIAKELKARRLMIISDVEGVLDNEKKLIPEINLSKANKLIEQFPVVRINA